MAGPLPSSPSQRIVTQPGPLAIALYRLSHRLWKANLTTPAEILWRVNLFLTGADMRRRLGALEAEVRVLKDLLEERPAVTDE